LNAVVDFTATRQVLDFGKETSVELFFILDPSLDSHRASLSMTKPGFDTSKSPMVIESRPNESPKRLKETAQE
jgi:hypothetical protein